MAESQRYSDISIRDQEFPSDPAMSEISFTKVTLRDDQGKPIHSDSTVIRCTDDDLRDLRDAIDTRLAERENRVVVEELDLVEEYRRMSQGYQAGD